MRALDHGDGSASRALTFAEVGAGGIRWRVGHAGGRKRGCVLLLHGFTGRAESWNAVVERLPSMPLWIPDLPGHGKTDPPLPPVEWRMPRLAEALRDLLDRLEIGVIDLVGYSMGGRAALQFAVSAGERVRRLVLIGVTPGIESAEERVARVEADLALAGLLEDKGIEAFVDFWENLPLFATQRSLPAETKARLRNERLSHDPSALAAALRAFGTGFQEPIHASLSAITAPTLLVVGERDRKFRGIAEAMRPRLPSARVEIVERAGHSVPSERPEALSALLDSFLSPTDVQGGSTP